MLLIGGNSAYEYLHQKVYSSFIGVEYAKFLTEQKFIFFWVGF